MYIRSRKKNTQWNMVIRYGSLALAMVSGVIMVPYYLKFIPIDVYGAWLASGNMLAWLSTMDPGLTIVLQQQVGAAYGKQDYQGIRMILGGGLIIGGFVFIFTNVLGLVCAHNLIAWLKLSSTIDSTQLVQAFSLAVIGTSLMLFSFAISSINQGLQGALGSGLITNGIIVISLLLTIILLNKGFGVFALAINLVFVGVCHTIGQGVYLVWRVTSEKIGFSFTYSSVVNLAKLLFYTFLGRSSGIIANNIDLIITSRFLGPETVAVLALTRKAPDFSKELVNQPSVAFMPSVSHLIGSGETYKARDVLIRFARILLWMLCLVIGGLITLNDDFVRLWVGPHLFAGNTINLILSGAILFTLAASCLGNLCFALGNIKGNSLASLAQSLSFIPLVIVGTKYFGLLGTVLAPLISVFIVSVWYFPRSFSRLLKLSSEDRKNFMHEGISSLAVMFSLIFGFSWFYPINWSQFIVVMIGFCSLYCCLVYMVSRNFRSEINGVILKLPVTPA